MVPQALHVFNPGKEKMMQHLENMIKVEPRSHGGRLRKLMDVMG